jgi:ribosomal protein L11 methyltransferase
MKYYEVNFTLSPLNSDACDLLAALAGEAGFETFEETEEGLTGYVQQQLFDPSQLDELLQSFPFPDVTVSYNVGEAEDRDWNEQWEQEGFDPIVVDNRLVIHDGRHLPEQLSTVNYQLSIEIDARLAFGTGTHETTRMVCSTLLTLPLDGKRVLDCGCGTGILGIVAMKLGASACTAYDIDEWSVDNTRHNAVINQVDITPLLGDATILNKVEGKFGLVMANINRNILLNDLPTFRSKMADDAQLILSGFYTADIPLLVDKAEECGLRLVSQLEENGWACLLLATK